MARTINKLTALAVSRAKKRGYIADGAGLYLQVGPNGSKSWVFRFRHDGRLREMGLGPTHTVSLAQARDQALACRQQRRADIDPIAVRQTTRAKGHTFSEAAQAYIAAHKASWSNRRHAEQWGKSLAAYVYPTIGGVPVADIRVEHIHSILAPLWQTKTETASRVRGRVESVLDYASARGWRSGENPARWRGHLANLLPKRQKVTTVKHHAAMAYGDLPAFMTFLANQTGSTAAAALRFLILTAMRTKETLQAVWSEIDLEGATWTIPAPRMKARSEHRVPLSDPALAILRPLYDTRTSGYVFPGLIDGQPLSPNSLLNYLQRTGQTGITVHGLRSSFRDWAAEKADYPREVIEMALAHAVGSKTEQAYRRTDLFDKRRLLMTEWASFCTNVTVG